MAKLVKRSLAKLDNFDRRVSVYLSALAQGRMQAVNVYSF